MDILIPMNRKTVTYAHGDFRVDITETEELFDVYLWHKDYGIKEQMFGLFKTSLAHDGRPVQEIVLNNLPEYERDYEEQYFD